MKIKIIHNKITRIIAVIVVVALVYTYPLSWIMARGIGESRTAIILTTEGIGKGFNPKGGFLDINAIKSEQVLQQAIWEMEMENAITVDELAQKIRIIPYVPGNALDNLKNPTIVGLTPSITERRLYPYQFTIILEDDGIIPSPVKSNAILGAIMESYRGYLEDEYMGTLPKNNYDEAYFAKIDYPEIIKILNQEVSILNNYINEYVRDLPEFRAYNGLAFSDVLEQSRLMQMVDIRDMESLIYWYVLTKNQDIRKSYEEIRLERADSRLQSVDGTAKGIQEMVDIYNNSTNYVFPQENISAIGGTKGNAYYGALAAQLINAKKQSIDIKYEQEKIRANIEKIENGAMLTEEAYVLMTKSIDQGVVDVMDRIEKTRVQVDAMIKEYYDTNISPKIKVSTPRYQVNAWGDPLINLILLFVAAGAGFGLYRLLIKKRPFFDRLYKVRERVSTIRKRYEKETE